MRIVHQAHEVCSQRFDHPHVLRHLLPGQREALVPPHVVPTDPVQHQPVSVQLELIASDRHVPESCATTTLVFSLLAPQPRPKFIQVWLLGRPQVRSVHVKRHLRFAFAGGNLHLLLRPRYFHVALR